MRGILLLIVMSGAAAFADDAKAPAARVREPVNKPAELLKCKPPTSKEEARVREAAESLNFSDHEVLGRLIFTETLATGLYAKRCKAENPSALMEAIGWVVMNRLEKYSPKRDDPKPDAIFHVVFEKGQFSTSFSSKNSNPFARAFLCPLEAQAYLTAVKSTPEAFDIYTSSKEVAARILDNYQRQGIDPAYRKITKVFMPNSEFGGNVRPAWAKNPVKVIEGDKPCAEFYK